MGRVTRAAVSALALLLGVVLAGCGGGGAPTDASEKDFCAAQADLFADIDLSGDPSNDEVAASLHHWADEVEEVGTPKGISDDARSGFEEVVDLARAVDAEDFDKTGGTGMAPDNLSPTLQKKVDLFTSYVGETCNGTGTQGLPTVPELPSATG
jgi:hypothetical protein